ncbi:MAG: tetratricopeptide repeat protein [Sedimentisphaerales bacterium]|jgi:Tfp pilus assembly protein PilF
MSNKLTKYSSFWICLTLTLTTVAVYWEVCSYDFVNYDDRGYVYKNPNIQDGITLQAVKWAFTTGYASNWHPLTWLSHMLDWQFFGPNAGGHHLTNLIFHIANTLLLFLVLRRMTNAFWQSAFVAALFALHPLHVESVAWIAERKDVLSTFFWILTMWAYLRYVKHPNVLRYLFALLMFAFGLMSKPMLVTLPFVLLLLDYWPLERFGKRTIFYLIREKIPFIVLSTASSVITFLVQRSSGSVVTTTVIPLQVFVSNAFVSYVKYIEKMIWPSRLAVLYPHPLNNLTAGQVAAAVLILLVISVLVIRLAASRRYLLAGWFWYLGTLVPVIGFIQVGNQAMADRYSYITLTGLFIIIAWGVSDLLARWKYKKIVLASLAVLIVSTLSICTYNQLRYWRNTLTLFQHALDVTENNYIAHLQMAEFLYEQQRLDEAVTEYQKYLQIMPNDPDVLNAFGVILGRLGRHDEAVRYLIKALQIKPDFADAHANIGYALIIRGNLDEAAVHLAKALQLDPNSALVHYHFGNILVQSGKINEAVTHFEKALQLKPDWVELMNTMAWYLAVNEKTAVRNPDKAVKLAQRACELTNYEEPELLDTLAVAYAAAGNFSKAIEVTGKALELCQSSQRATLKKELESRLVLYKTGKPYIENEQ